MSSLLWDFRWVSLPGCSAAALCGEAALEPPLDKLTLPQSLEYRRCLGSTPPTCSLSNMGLLQPFAPRVCQPHTTSSCSCSSRCTDIMMAWEGKAPTSALGSVHYQKCCHPGLGCQHLIAFLSLQCATACNHEAACHILNTGREDSDGKIPPDHMIGEFVYG